MTKKEVENKQGVKTRIELAFLNTALEKGGKILDELTQGKTISEFEVSENALTISLGDFKKTKDGKRIDVATGKVLSGTEKGNSERDM